MFCVVIFHNAFALAAKIKNKTKRKQTNKQKNISAVPQEQKPQIRAAHTAVQRQRGDAQRDEGEATY